MSARGDTATVPSIDESTRTAHWGWDEHRYFGHRVFEELVGHESLAGLVGLAILGRRLTADEAGMLDDAAAVNTLGDPRIWPLKLTRTIASYGRIMPALSAGVLMLDGGRVGVPEDLDQAAVFFMSDQSKFCTGQILAVDGGWSVSEGQINPRD